MDELATAVLMELSMKTSLGSAKYMCKLNDGTLNIRLEGLMFRLLQVRC